MAIDKERDCSKSVDTHETLAQLLTQVMETTKQSGTLEEMEKLKDAFRRFSCKEQFSIGDIVVWKNGLKNRKRPAYGAPAIVVETFSVPYFDEEEATGSPYFREPLDLRLGLIDEAGDFVTYVYDSRRFERFVDVDKRIQDMLLGISNTPTQDGSSGA